jgi:hypothetical protein
MLRSLILDYATLKAFKVRLTRYNWTAKNKNSKGLIFFLAERVTQLYLLDSQAENTVLTNNKYMMKINM